MDTQEKKDVPPVATVQINAQTIPSDNLKNVEILKCKRCGGTGTYKTIETTTTGGREMSISCDHNVEPPQKLISNDEVIAVVQAVTEPVAQGIVVNQEKAVQKHPGGRPSKYNAEMLAKANAYLAKCNGEVDGKPRMPFIEELAVICKVDDDTIYGWAEANKEFSVTIKNLKTLQKLRTVQRGFNAKNPTFAIFMLKANHGMIEAGRDDASKDREVKVSITRE
jgi:hypothetical protein